MLLRSVARDRSMHEPPDLAPLGSMRIPSPFLEYSRRLAAANVDSRKPNRRRSRPGLRSVVGMKELLPLHLAESATSSHYPSSSHLATIYSSTPNLGAERPPEMASCTSTRCVCLSSSEAMQAPIASPQTLFDLGIFRPVARINGSCSPLGDDVGDPRQSLSLASPFDEDHIEDFFDDDDDDDEEEFSDAWETADGNPPTSPQTRLDASCSSWPSLEQTHRCGAAASRMSEGSDCSHSSEMIEKQSLWPLSRNSSETSWLEDATDDDQEHDEVEEASSHTYRAKADRHFFNALHPQYSARSMGDCIVVSRMGSSSSIVPLMLTGTHNSAMRRR